MSECVCVRACIRARMRACVHTCARACVRACVRACASTRVYESESILLPLELIGPMQHTKEYETIDDITV